MCVAVPGKVISVSGTKATVDFNGNRIEAEAGLVRIMPGDHVLVHAGCILQVLRDDEAEILRELFEELDNL